MAAKTPQLAQRIKKTLRQMILSPYRAFKVLCFSIGFAVLTVSVALIFYGYAFYRSTADLGRYTFANLQSLAQKRTANHQLDRKWHGKWFPISAVSRDFIYSVVMSEDATFFEHDGINFNAIVSSMAENLRERKAAYGGSTISQQVVKNLFLDNEKSVSRKLREIIITRGLEKYFSKNQILELYLNIAELGPDIYGVGVASEHYFKKLPSEINAAEGAFVASLLPSPKRYYYSVVENRNLTFARRKRINRVLRDMMVQEYISQSQYRSYSHFDFLGKVNRAPARSR